MRVLLVILYIVNLTLSAVLVAIPGVISVKLAIRLWRVNKKMMLLPLVVYAGHLFTQYVLGVSVWVVVSAVAVGLILGRLRAYCENKEVRLRSISE